jgi:hypothetical protein
MCEKLLVNPLIEDYEILEEADDARDALTCASCAPQ